MDDQRCRSSNETWQGFRVGVKVGQRAMYRTKIGVCDHFSLSICFLQSTDGLVECRISKSCALMLACGIAHCSANITRKGFLNTVFSVINTKSCFLLGSVPDWEQQEAVLLCLWGAVFRSFTLPKDGSTSRHSHFREILT